MADIVDGVNEIGMIRSRRHRATETQMPVVHIQDIEFTPAVVHVRKGRAVEWRWEDEVVSHTVSSRGKRRFRNSGARQHDATYRFRFRRKGTYRYVCEIHPNMKGRVEVK